MRLNRRTFIQRAGVLAAVVTGHQIVGQLPGALGMASPLDAAPRFSSSVNLVTNPSFEADGVTSSISGWTLVR